MVSNLGFKLNSFAPISGFGMHRRRRVGYGEGLFRKKRVVHRHVGIGEGLFRKKRVVHRHVGQGLPRKIVGTVIKHIGHALVDRLGSAISGSGSFKLTGRGTRKRRVAHRKPRRVLTTFGGYRPRTHRRRIRVMI